MEGRRAEPPILCYWCVLSVGPRNQGLSKNSGTLQTDLRIVEMNTSRFLFTRLLMFECA